MVQKCLFFYLHPRCGEVYNLGGGRKNSISVLEAIALAEHLLNKPFRTTYIDKNREGDHICYISDLTKIKSHFPDWQITRSLDSIFQEMATMYLLQR